MTLREQVMRVRAASQEAALAGETLKNKALYAMADALEASCEAIVAANALDMERSEKAGAPAQFLDRLMLDEKRVADMARGLREIAALPDPIGETKRMWKRPNGLEIGRKVVPLGVLAIIFEARPNVTVDSIGLCLKSGNAAILRGGSDAIDSNRRIVEVMKAAAGDAGYPAEAIMLVEDTSRKSAEALMKMNDLIDVLVPRGGAGLIQTVMQTATVPVIQTGVGVCHVYVDKHADLQMGSDIIFNAKVSRPSVCNAAETLLVHQDVAGAFLPAALDRLRAGGVELRGDEKTRAVAPWVLPATDEDWAAEYGALILSVKVVASMDEALEHIARYGTRHSEAIVTGHLERSRKFLDRVDAAAVYVNASTRFTDGFEFGFGAEIGISTQKLHARGPMGLPELTTIKYIIIGNGQTR
ncbi:MAG: glutamate-5-semialdehyde dehydrogenase [Christensenellales bacterium]|jgi:glutamate-5-semialdehyde dehydrogenase